MLRFTIRGIFARKLRLLLSSFAILLGISFASGAFVLTDTLSGVFDNLFATVNSNTAVTVEGVAAFGDDSDREPVNQSVLAAVAKVPGVREARGDSGGQGSLVLPNGDVLGKGGPPVIGTDYQPKSYQETLEQVSGAVPVGIAQIAVDKRTADQHSITVGEQVGLVGRGAERRVTVVGIVQLKGGASLAGATIVAMDSRSAQAVFGIPGTYTNIVVAADSGVSESELAGRISKVLPTGVEAVTQTSANAQESSQIKKGLSFFNTFLQVFAYIAVFVGAFLIFNTFSMLVAQRTRELALVRALGANRRQVMLSVMGEALAVGLVASIGGFVVGIGLAVGLRALLGALIGLPSAHTVIKLRTFLYSLIVGVGITALAAYFPARRAGRVAPVKALRESGPAETSSLVVRTSSGGAILALGILVLALGIGQSSLTLIGFGAVLAVVGVAVFSPVLVRPVLGTLGAPLARLGVSGKLGLGNALRNPRRTSSTAAALMIGLALVTTISTMAASIKKSITHTVATSLGADYIIHTEQFDGFQPALLTAVKKVPDIAAVAGFSQAKAELGNDVVTIQGADPATLQQVLKLTVEHGSLAQLSTGLALSSSKASSLGAHVGDTVKVTWAKTGVHPLPVVAIFKDNQLAGDDLVSTATYDANVTDQKLVIVAVRVASGHSLASVRPGLAAAIQGFPTVKLQNQAQFVKSQGDQVDTVLNIVSVLLTLSVIIALLGVVNTLALSVVERTRELGMLRGVGLQRRQLKRMIRTEGVLISVFGAILGIVVGIGFGYALTTALHDQGITEFAVPVGRIVVVLLVAAVGGVVASALPARRAAKLNVLQAIATA